MHSPRRLVVAGLAAVMAAALGAAIAGTGQTYAGFSDFATVTGQARAGVWAPDPPADCYIKNANYPGGIVWGTEGPDEITAGNKGQIIMGLGGDDIIHGNNAKDCLVGGAGNDHLDAGNTDETTTASPSGTSKNDHENGKDILLGGEGDDRLEGGNGKDYFDGGGQPGDVCVGDNGKDEFVGCTTVEAGRGDSKKTQSDAGTLTPDALTITSGPEQAGDPAAEPAGVPSTDQQHQKQDVQNPSDDSATVEGSTPAGEPQQLESSTTEPAPPPTESNASEPATDTAKQGTGPSSTSAATSGTADAACPGVRTATPAENEPAATDGTAGTSNDCPAAP